MAKKRDDFEENDFFEDDELEEIEPLDEDELEVVESVDGDDMEIVEALDEDELEIVEPVGEDDLEVVDPLDEDEDEDELEIVEPVAEDDLEVVEALDEDDELEIVEPVAEDDLEVVEPVAEDDLEEVEEIDLSAIESTVADELKSEDSVFDDLEPVVPVDEADDAEDELDVVEPVDEDEAPSGPPPLIPPPLPPSKPTMLSSKAPAQTKLAKKSPAPTQLAKKSPEPTKLAKKSPQPTKLSKKSPEPTKLASGDLDSLEPADDETADGTMQYTTSSGDVKDAADEDVHVSAVDFTDSDPETQDLDKLLEEELPVEDVAEAKEVSDSADDLETIGDMAMEQEIADLMGDEGEPIDKDIEDEEPDLSGMFDSGEQQLISDSDAADGPSLADVDISAPAAFDELTGDDIEDVDDVDFLAGDQLLDDEGSAVDLGGDPQKGSQLSGVDPIADDIESGTELGAGVGDIDDLDALDEVDEVSEVDAADILAEDDDESVGVNLDATPVPGTKQESQLVDVDDDDLMDVDPADLLDDEPMPAAAPKGKKKKKKKAAADSDVIADDYEEFDEPQRSGRRGRTATAPKKTKRFRWMIIGMFFMTLLVAGGGAGVWYWKPDLIDEAIKMIPESPNMDAKAKQLHNLKNGPELQAVVFINEGKYSEAVTSLKEAETAAAKNLRGHARLLKYLHDTEQAKQPPVLAHPEVQSALKDLEEAKQKILADQIRNAFAGAQWKIKAEKLTPGDSAAKEIAKLLSAPLAETPTQVSALMKRKDDLEKNNQEYVKALKKVDPTIPATDLDPKKLDAVVGSLAKSDADLKSVNNILDKAAKIQEAGSKGVQALVDQKIALDKLIAEVNAILKAADLKDSGPKGVKELVQVRTALEKEKAKLTAAIDAAGKELYELSPKTKDPLTNLVEGAKVAKKRADSPITLPLSHIFSTLGDVGKGAGNFLTRSLETGGMAVELGYFRSLDKFVEKPADRLDRWMALLKNDKHRDKGDLDQATKDAEWVRSPNSKSSDEAKVKALYVLALVERNKGSFDKSRQLLSEVKAEADKGKLNGEWLSGATASKTELDDPKAYYLPLAENKAKLGDIDGAMKALQVGLEAKPNHPALLYARASLLFDGNKQSVLTVETANQIRQDAGAAQGDKEVAVRATLLLARLEEKLRHWDKAEEYYRQAMKLSNPTDAEKNAIRLAWGNFLLRDRLGDPVLPLPEEKPKPMPPKVDPAPKAKPMPPKVDPAPKAKPFPPKPNPVPPKANPIPPAPKLPPLETSRVGSPQVFSLVSWIVGQNGEVPNPKEDPAEKAKTDEAIKTANEIIKSAKDDKTKGQGHMLLGRALFKQGRRNAGMKEFAKGMSLAFPGIGGDALQEMLENHPSFRRPDSMSRSNATLANQYFGQGLHQYWAKQYDAAEHQFEKAVQYYRKDARYFYYLGLAQLYQNTVAKRKDAETSFEEGAALESESLPPASEINISLERIQGPIRQYLDRIRYGLSTKIGS